MDRFVEIRFQGKFNQFFIVTYQILDSSSQIIERGEAALPQCPELVMNLKDWRRAYHADVKQPRFEDIEASITNASDINHRELASNLKQSLNDWLSSPEFQPVKDKLMSKLNPDQVILVGIDVADPELKYAPWHLWNFFEVFPKADFALLRPSFSKVNTRNYGKSKLNVLAIIGDSRGINTQDDTTIIEKLPYINKPQIMGEPSKQAVRDVLNGSMNTDILFFAGHGRKQQDRGEICINSSDTLSIGEIRSALRKRIKQGLQLAIFNSCDGLELGAEIADLHIPQAIVMKEAVPDQIAQRFLKSFLQEFSQEGVSLAYAMRRTRDRLTDEDKEYPYASWLPVLYYNPSEPLMAWPKPNFAQKHPWRTGLAVSCLIGLLSLGTAFAISGNPKKPVLDPIINLENNVYSRYFQLPLPKDWQIENELNIVTGDELHLYLSGNKDITISLNIRNLEKPDNQSLTLDEYSKQFIDNLQGSWNNFVINEKGLIGVGSSRGYRVIFSTAEENKKYKKSSTILLNNNKAYILTYSAPEELFNSHNTIVSTLLNSLKFNY